MNREILIDALEDLDRGLIERYFEIKEKLKKKRFARNSLFRWIAVAVCVSIMLIGGNTFYKEHRQKMLIEQLGSYPVYHIDEAADTIRIFLPGKQYVCDYGTIYHMGYDEDGIKIYFVKSTDDRIDISLLGCIDSSVYPSPMVIATTDVNEDVTLDHVRYEYDLLQIVVNGVEMDKIPDEIGEYEIIINVSEMKQMCEFINHIKINGFGYFQTGRIYAEGDGDH